MSFWKGKFQDRVVMMISAQTSIGRILVSCFKGGQKIILQNDLMIISAFDD